MPTNEIKQKYLADNKYPKKCLTFGLGCKDQWIAWSFLELGEMSSWSLYYNTFFDFISSDKDTSTRRNYPGSVVLCIHSPTHTADPQARWYRISRSYPFAAEKATWATNLSVSDADGHAPS